MEHKRLVALLSSVCSHDIIVHQASVRQAKLVSAAFARPRRSQPASRIRSFFCTSFLAATGPRRHFAGIHAPPSKKSLGIRPRVLGEPGISEYFVAWDRGVYKRIDCVSGRIAEAWCEDIARGRGSEPGGERHAKSHGIYRHCANSAQRSYGD